MGPFAVSANGSSVQTASGPQSLLSAGKPLSKLDTTNIVSFQTISVLFNREPPQPGALSYSNTAIYTFAHGYNYIPSVWLQWQNPSPQSPGNPSNGSAATTFYTFGDDSASAELLSDGLGVSPGFNGQPLLGLTVYNNGGSLIQTTVASIIAKVDATNVYVSVLKESLATISGSVIPIYLVGVTVNTRMYVFAEPGTTSTY